MPLVPATYFIVNVRQNKAALLKDKNDGTPVVSATTKLDPKDTKQQWKVTAEGNFYSIKNVSAERYANTGVRAQTEDPVEGRGASQQYDIVETSVPGKYTIATTDSRLFWHLPDDQDGSPIILSTGATDQRNWWTFKTPEAPKQ
ncbi:hypothetical protein AMATHDRAFT_65105 [Amanita thiersii Skay4041]|uniref:Ricin B lectin domain-containing protein n=1 Tax=Amanita thiersii Skay4041 TaxID=703135 RepID=A0A2A9NC19_9AGAR|nr:hypothetical protein AMATHDRAFT_65105 [Amanita thiersii Skay4041]